MKTWEQALGDAVVTGAALNVVLDPIFMFEWGFNLGVEGASIATTVSQFVTFFILIWFYASGRSIIKIRPRRVRFHWKLIGSVTAIGIPTAVIQIALAVATSLTNIAAKPLPDSDQIIAAYGVVQRLVLIGCSSEPEMTESVLRTTAQAAALFGAIADGGWIGLAADPAHGGGGLPAYRRRFQGFLS